MAPAANPASSSDGIRIREANSKDVEALTRVINAAFVAERIVFDGDRLDIAAVRAYLEKGTFLAAESEGKCVVGSVFVELKGERAYLGLLSVEPAKQGLGLGRELIAAAEEYARRAGARVMNLRVISARGELIPFYKRAGYEQTGTAPFAPELVTKIPAYYILLSKTL